jgi:hypothetical protein
MRIIIPHAKLEAHRVYSYGHNLPTTISSDISGGSAIIGVTCLV